MSLFNFRNLRLRNGAGLKAGLIIKNFIIDGDSRTLAVILSDGIKDSYSALIEPQTSENGGVPPP